MPYWLRLARTNAAPGQNPWTAAPRTFILKRRTNVLHPSGLEGYDVVNPSKPNIRRAPGQGHEGLLGEGLLRHVDRRSQCAQRPESRRYLWRLREQEEALRDVPRPLPRHVHRRVVHTSRDARC